MSDITTRHQCLLAYNLPTSVILSLNKPAFAISTVFLAMTFLGTKMKTGKKLLISMHKNRNKNAIICRMQKIGRKIISGKWIIKITHDRNCLQNKKYKGFLVRANTVWIRYELAW